MQKPSLRIAMTVDPEIPVPPLHYGGIERIVNMLVHGLQQRGHEVHLFANPQSTIETHLAPYPASTSRSIRDTINNTRYIWSYIQQHGPFDVIHSFARLIYLLPWMPLRVPKIQSYQRAISPRSVRYGSLLGGQSLCFTTCSSYNAAPVRQFGGRWEIIYNGVDTDFYSFSPQVVPDAPLMFLGRVERIKGAHTAIAVAKATNRKLVIAGNHATSGPDADYFQGEILPHCDNKQIFYVGPVNDQQKNELLGKAAAMLFPIDIEEPFGIVIAEALACGTPVIGFKRGAVDELIEHGTTGFVCQTIDDMIAAVYQVDRLDRAACRQLAEQRYSAHVIVEQYESLYRSLVAR